VELHYIKLLISFTLNSDISDPYLLFTCRSDFDAAFRRTLSCKRSGCDGCTLTGGCPYPANFGQKMAKDPDAIRRHQKPPLPFVFRFPMLPPTPNRGKSLECSLTLVGSAAQEVDLFVEAFTRVLAKMQATVISIEAEAPGGGRSLVAAGEPLPILSPLDPALSGPLRPDRIAISFLTPLKLMHDGRLLKELRFSHLARALMRRISSLAYYYEGAAPDLDYRWLSRESEAVTTVSSDCRFVSWGDRPIGITGAVSFAGDLEPFHLLLQSGLATHLGKNSSFGFGAYRILA
jgi:hypothetical protein